MAKVKKQLLASAADGEWISVPHTGLQGSFGIGVGCGLSTSANLTYSVEYTMDDPQLKQDVSITRSTTTATITFTAGGTAYNHGLITGDSITVAGSGDSNLDGTYSFTRTSDTAGTYTVADTGISSAKAKCVTMKVFTATDFSSLTVAAQGGFVLPVTAVRSTISSYTAGQLTVNFVFSPS